MRFFKWLYYLDIEPETRNKLSRSEKKPECIMGISKLRRKELQQLTKTRVVNVDSENQIYDVYVGRGKERLGLRRSKWGNPYEIGKDGTREEVISKHKAWLWKNKELLHDVFTELPGKTLGCHCVPEPCHGDILLKLANSKFSCYYCINFQTDNEKEYSVHIITKHRQGTLAYPNGAAIKKFGLVPQKKPWEI
jgi:hypothetical protein